jgi:hypothetical protein
MPATYPLSVTTAVEASRAPLPAEIASSLLTLATSGVPIRLVSRLAEDLDLALGGRPLADVDVVRIVAMLSRAAGPWLPTPRRFAAIVEQLDGLLAGAGCDRGDVLAVAGDLEEAFRARRGQGRGQGPEAWL